MTTITRYRGRTSLAISLIAAMLLALPLHSVRATSTTGDSQIFVGRGGAASGPFILLGGRYAVQVEALYNSLWDPDQTGECFFSAYMYGVTPSRQVIHVPL